MSHLDEQPLFTFRYGRSFNPDAPPWAKRHAPLWHLRYDVPKVDPLHRCRCAANTGLQVEQCGLAATQEDILCDECRQWCIAVDGAGEFHLLADLHPLGSDRG